MISSSPERRVEATVRNVTISVLPAILLIHVKVTKFCFLYVEIVCVYKYILCIEILCFVSHWKNICGLEKPSKHTDMRTVGPCADSECNYISQ